MFGPGGVLWLLAHELRIGWRGGIGTARSRTVIGYAFLVVVSLFVGYWVALGLSHVQPELDREILGVAGIVLAFLFTFMLAQALMLITESLYQRGDLDLLLASPLPPWRILVVRMAAVALNAASLYLILLCAVFVWFPLLGGWAWAGIFPVVACLSLLATAIGLVLARFLFLLIGPRATRTAAQVIASLIGAGFFLALQSQNFLPRDERLRLLEEIMGRIIPVLGDAHSIVSLPARAALGQPLAMGAWITLAIVAYLGGVWWFAARFAVNAAAIAGVPGGPKRRSERTTRIRGGLRQTLVRKEWRLLLRDPLLLSQILVQLLYLLPLFFVFGSHVTEVGFERYSVATFSSAFVLLATSLAASLAWLTVSAEDAPDLIAAAPVSRDQIDNAKALAAGAPIAMLMLAPAAAAAWVEPIAGVWLLVGSVLSVASTCLIAVWHQAPGSRRAFRRRSRGSIWVNLARAFITLCWVAGTGLAVAGWEIVALIPTLIAAGLLLALHESRRSASTVVRPLQGRKASL